MLHRDVRFFDLDYTDRPRLKNYGNQLFNLIIGLLCWLPFALESLSFELVNP